MAARTDLARVARLLREIARCRPVPEVRLTDRRVSQYVRRGRRKWIEISRSALRRKLAVPKAELAHEYAHFLLDRTWPYRVWASFVAVAIVLGAVAALAGAVLALRSQEPAVAIAGFGLILGGLCGGALLSRWSEFRADFVAAELVGEDDVVEWLDCLQKIHGGLDRRTRWASYATHPSPTRRKHALLLSNQQAIPEVE
jgi:Zn-dependent protease with chaperone function